LVKAEGEGEDEGEEEEARRPRGRPGAKGGEGREGDVEDDARIFSALIYRRNLGEQRAKDGVLSAVARVRRAGEALSSTRARDQALAGQPDGRPLFGYQ